LRKRYLKICASLTISGLILSLAGCGEMAPTGIQPGGRSLSPVPDSGPWKLIPAAQRAEAQRRFRSQPEVLKLDRDLIVFRYDQSSGGGYWLSAKEYADPREAARLLALPGDASSIRFEKFYIPRGSTVLWGRAAARANEEGFSPEAVGGGQLVFLPNPSLAKPLKTQATKSSTNAKADSDKKAAEPAMKTKPQSR